MASKRLIKDVLSEDEMYSIVQAAERSLKKLESKATSSDWVKRIEDRFNDFDRQHSSEETVAFIASVATCMFKSLEEEDKISVKMLSTDKLVQQISDFSTTKKKFTIRFRGTKKEEYFDIFIV